MKYEAPQVTELTDAIDAIQDCKCSNSGELNLDPSPAYEDWE